MTISSKILDITAVLIVMAALTSNVYAGGNPQEIKRFDEACGNDIKSFCSQVQPGDGRISACLYAHTDLISDSCYSVTERVGVILEGVFDGIETFYAACGADLMKHCADKQPGQGEQLACLRENTANISPGCVAAMPAYGPTNP